MKTKEEMIKELEVRIEVLEKELQKIKSEVTMLKGTKDVVNDSMKKSLEGIRIEDLEFSVRTFYCLKREGINKLEELVTFLDSDLAMRNLGVYEKKEITEKLEYVIGKPELIHELKEKAQKIRKQNEEAKALSLKMTTSIIPAAEMYARIRIKAKEEGIGFYHLGSGVFSRIYRYFKKYRGNINKVVNNERGRLVTFKFAEECINGKHPEMYKLLTSDNVTDINLIKSAILEDFKENNVFTNHETISYKDSLKYIKLIQKYEE